MKYLLMFWWWEVALAGTMAAIKAMSERADVLALPYVDRVAWISLATEDL